VNGREAAEDVVQETWLAVTRGVDRFEGRSSLRTWIFAILVNQARTRGTSDARTRTVTSTLDELGPEDLVPADRFTGSTGRGKWSPPLAAWQNDPQLRSDHAAGLAELAAAISELPLRRRQVLVLRDIEGWTAPEVTELLGVTEGNQRVLLHRARNTLRCRLEQGAGGS
jgi:RNA polymerase sigma-70 factor (ECF subfamily)